MSVKHIFATAEVGLFTTGLNLLSSGKLWKSLVFFAGGIFMDFLRNQEDKKQYGKELKESNPNTKTSNNDDENKQDNPTFCRAIPMDSSNISCGVEYLVSDAVRKGGTTIIYAEKGEGKSILSHQIAQSIAEGSPCLAFPKDTSHKPQPVIYLDAELTPADDKNRGYSNIANLKIFDRFNYNSAEDLRIDSENFLKDVHEDCTIVLDCISNQKFGWCLSNPSSMKEFNRVLDMIKEKAKKEREVTISFIVITHASSSGDKIKGCQDYYQNATSIIEIQKACANTDRVINVRKNRSGSEGSWTVKIVQQSPTLGVHFECYNTSTPNTSQNPATHSKTTMPAPNVPPSINTPIKSANTPAMTPEEELIQTLSDMGYTLENVLEMEKQANKNKEIRKQLYLIVTRLQENKRLTWDFIKQSINVSKQRYQHWKD